MADELRAKFGKELRNLREEAGMTQKELAEKTNLDHTYISKIEKGKASSIPSREAIRSIADVFDEDEGRLSKLAGRPLKEEGLETGKIDKWGAYLYKLFTEKLYEDPDSIVREYISNPVQEQANEITIDRDNPDDCSVLTIHSDVGMEKDFLNEALNVAISRYRGDEDKIGEHGIGIYAASSICKEIRIKTTPEGVEEGYEVILPVREWLNRSSGNISLEELGKYEWDIYPAEAEEDFTMVQIIDIKSGRPKEKIEDDTWFRSRLEQILPVEFDEEFDSNLRERIENFLKRYDIPGKFSANVKLDGEKITKRYWDELRWVEGASSFKIPNSSDDPLAVGWGLIRPLTSAERGGKLSTYADREEKERIEKLEGFQIRQKNVTVYDRDWSHDVFGARWWTGEIHILSDDIKPNASRDRFTESDEWDHLEDKLKEKIGELKQEAEDQFYKWKIEHIKKEFSPLEGIVGDRTSKKLKDKIGTIDRIRKASLEEFKDVEGIGNNKANKLYSFLEFKKEDQFSGDEAKKLVDLIDEEQIGPGAFPKLTSLITEHNLSFDEAEDYVLLIGEAGLSDNEAEEFIISVKEEELGLDETQEVVELVEEKGIEEMKKSSEKELTRQGLSNEVAKKIAPKYDEEGVEKSIRIESEEEWNSVVNRILEYDFLSKRESRLLELVFTCFKKFQSSSDSEDPLEFLYEFEDKLTDRFEVGS